MRCKGRKEQEVETTEVIVNCHLSSRHLVIAFFDPFDENVYLPEEIFGRDYERDVKVHHAPIPALEYFVGR